MLERAIRLSVLFFTLSLAPDLAAGASPPWAETLRFPSDGAQVIQKWIAVGSMCSGGSDTLGTVTATIEALTPEPGHYQATFDVSAFSLDNLLHAVGEPPHFARDCTFRLGVALPPGTRIERVYVRTAWVLNKTSDSELTTLARVVQGPTELVNDDRKFLSGVAEQGYNQAVDLNHIFVDSGTTDTCGSKTIIGTDITWIAKLPSQQERVTVFSGGAGELVLGIVLDTCLQ